MSSKEILRAERDGVMVGFMLGIKFTVMVLSLLWVVLR
jgi:hypothetical protein